MKKIIFVIPNLMHGGAERVLVNLVNALDKSRFRVTVLSVFDCGVNRADLLPDVEYRYVYKKQFRGNSHFFKFFSPEQLYGRFVKEKYDIAVSFLEGTSARIVAGCTDKNTKKICWIHTSLADSAVYSLGFRSRAEADECYAAFDKLVFVSDDVKKAFPLPSSDKNITLYNPIDGDKIRSLALLPGEYPISDGCFNICAVGKLIPVKGFDRLPAICRLLRADGINAHFYICGSGPEREKLLGIAEREGVSDYFTLTGFLENPYSVMARCDLFVCSSHREGFSSAACEALFCGVPIVTVAVQGMDELLLGGEYGKICENDSNSLYKAIKELCSDKDLYDKYKLNSQKRCERLDMKSAVSAVEDFFESL